MKNVQINVVNPKFSPLYTTENNAILLKYPCNNSYECTEYIFVLPPGKYKFEAYGGSGGSSDGRFTSAILNDRSGCIPQETVQLYKGNTECRLSVSGINKPGSGGYMSGVITLRKNTIVYASIAGMGEFSKGIAPQGGYNGGGNASESSYKSASGGGATDIRFEVNDLYHRVLVAGGSGGYEDAQGFWIYGRYNPTPIASQLYGFSFGQGESAGSKTSHPNSTSVGNSGDIGGSGGGWFGGFCSGSCSGGAGGGSSFVLTKTAKIPEGKIERYSDRYELIEEKEYAFLDRKYSFENVHNASGIWGGNGQVRITLIKLLRYGDAGTKDRHIIHFSYTLIHILICR